VYRKAQKVTRGTGPLGWHKQRLLRCYESCSRSKHRRLKYSAVLADSPFSHGQPDRSCGFSRRSSYCGPTGAGRTAS